MHPTSFRPLFSSTKIIYDGVRETENIIPGSVLEAETEAAQEVERLKSTGSDATFFTYHDCPEEGPVSDVVVLLTNSDAREYTGIDNAGRKLYAHQTQTRGLEPFSRALSQAMFDLGKISKAKFTYMARHGQSLDAMTETDV